ncbi:helix-turn-helix domain-containing protein [Micromonospora ureilytica]|nr:helix-turn-helix domain-containing protein [Micromonospora ureilytica]
MHRRFRTELGTTPLAWLTSQRINLACRLLEAGEPRLDTVARASGLGTSANLRTHIRRHTGLSPSAYRGRFTTTPPPHGVLRISSAKN